MYGSEIVCTEELSDVRITRDPAEKVGIYASRYPTQEVPENSHEGAASRRTHFGVVLGYGRREKQSMTVEVNH